MRGFQSKSKIDPFECHIFEEAIAHEMDFTRSQPQGYYKLINNLKRVSNLVYHYKIELKRVPRQTSQIADPPHGGKYSLNFVMIRCS